MSKFEESGGRPAKGFATSSADQATEIELSGADPLHAAGDLFGTIAADLRAAIELANDAVQTPEPADLLIALAALLGKVGAAADRAATACNGGPGVQDQDSWSLSPVGAAALGVLETMRRQRLAARRVEQLRGQA